jgi:hypothetical protein
VPNRATREQQLVAARALDNAQKPGAKPLGKEVLEEMMFIAKSATSSFQPITKEMAERANAAGQASVKERAGDMEKFGQWWDRTCYAAKELSKYQSPTYRAIMVAPAPETNQPERRKVFQLTIFDNPRLGKSAEIIEAVPVEIDRAAQKH